MDRSPEKVGVGDMKAREAEIARTGAEAVKYERHVVYRSPLTGRFYFASRVQVLSETARRVVGSKYDVTAYIEPYLLKKYRSRSPGQPT